MPTISILSLHPEILSIIGEKVRFTSHLLLIQLTAAEILAVDLFAMEISPSQSGLIGPEKYIPEYSEEEYDKMNETQRDCQLNYPGTYV